MNSFHEVKNWSIAAVANPDLAIGNTIKK